MELFVEWEDKYSVGIKKIDNQHKKLIEIINRLYYSRGNRPHTVLGKTIQELIEYTKTHFTDEERLMRENGYPDYQAHKKRQVDLAIAEKRWLPMYQPWSTNIWFDKALHLLHLAGWVGVERKDLKLLVVFSWA